ncbi:ATP-binding protein [Sinomonas sp. P10A9]|uniref:AAA family ATPase n=1 Tax=Sinomonas puerhi TaxID=3238584 RepID=A0AB39L614_9MICC
MAGRRLAGAPALVGRTDELAALAEAINAGCSGRTGTVLVTGDAGIGKTALVAAACDAADSRALILQGAALPMAAAEVPYLGLRSALRHAGADFGPVPLLDGVSRSDVPRLIDDWISEISERQPVVLAIDDLHWADPGTLDVLLYLMGGPDERRLAVFGTIRMRELEESHPLNQWLAVTRRLPNVATVPLGPLDRPETEAQLAHLLDGPPMQSLVTEVYARSAGNPYFTRLLTEGLTADAKHLPAGFPGDLRSAVLRSWRALPPKGRLLTQIMAIGGRSVGAELLRAAAAPAIDPPAVAGLLHLAADAGILELSADGMYWFHHPLIAELLEQGMSEDERRGWHAAFSSAYEQQAALVMAPAGDLALALADHHYHAGHRPEAYQWALKAADPDAPSITAAERLRMLQRAVALRDRLPAALEDRRDLWNRVREAAYLAGDFPAELEAVEMLLREVDAAREPLAAAELTMRQEQVTWWVGRAHFSINGSLKAVRLAEQYPDSWQYARAAADLAHAASWEGSPDASSLAEEALRAARRSGDRCALSFALSAAAAAAHMAGHRDDAVGFAEVSLTEAREAGDFLAFWSGLVWLANAREVTYISRGLGDILRWGREELAELDAPHAYASRIAADEAACYLAVGDWRKASEALRTVASLDPGPMGEATGLVQRARLAALQGRTEDALALVRNYEVLVPGHAEYAGHPFAAVSAEVYAAAGRPKDSYATAMTAATKDGAIPMGREWLVPLAARALADWVQEAKDRGRRTEDLLREVDRLQHRFPQVLHDPGFITAHFRTVIDAFECWYAAELGRARSEHDNGAQWAHTADACARASLLWEEAYACQRGAESFLLYGRGGTARGAQLLRRGLALARDLQARPVCNALEILAVHAHIPIQSVAHDDSGTPRLAGLTARERTILELVVAGRTYGEIARELVISEKTVSTHISHLLRKTGAANRVDLARLAARRVGN